MARRERKITSTVSGRFELRRVLVIVYLFNEVKVAMEKFRLNGDIPPLNVDRMFLWQPVTSNVLFPKETNTVNNEKSFVCSN